MSSVDTSPAQSVPATSTPTLPGARAEPAAVPVVDIDRLNDRWRLAFNAAEDAIGAARHGGPSVRFDAAELADLQHRLVYERAAVSSLITSLAREEHVTIHHPLAAPRATRRMLGLPAEVLACVFDLDGVLTASATIHAAAWADTFNEFLLRRMEATGERFAPYRPFNPATEYQRHLHGRTRIAGVHAFLASRGIRIDEGHPDDPPGTETVYGLGNRKAAALLARLARGSVLAFAGSRRYLEAAREAGLRCAVISESANTRAIIDGAGLAPLIDALVDGEAIAAEHLQLKPAPDTILAACHSLGAPPEATALFDTTLDGLDAGRAAGCRLVVGVERRGHDAEFRAHGASVVVSELGALLRADEPSLRAHGADLVVSDLGALLDPSVFGS